MEVRYTTGFDRDLTRLRDRLLKLRVNEAIDELKAAFRLADVSGVRRLTGVGPRYRIRIGDYRLIILL